MLLNFKISNFRSFKDEAVLDVTPVQIKEKEYSILKKKINNKEYKALSSSIIYGFNASGKSNLIKALRVFKMLIENGKTAGKNGSFLSLVPFAFDDLDKGPISMGITFIHEGQLFEYTLKIDGKFGLGESEYAVVYEQLKIDEVQEFLREYGNIEYAFADSSLFQNMKEVIEDNLLPSDLFLCNGFKFTQVEKYNKILDYFENKISIIHDINNLQSSPKQDGSKDYSAGITNKYINQIADVAGISGTEIIFLKDKDKENIKMYSRIGDMGISSHLIESIGTMRILNFMPVVIDTLIAGGVLVVDELDSSLHPMIVFSIVSAFHNDELNINKAQLIFTSHNPVFQKGQLMRRDEIKFVEKDKETKASTLYTLSDFGTAGKGAVKNTTDIMKNYMEGQYGAIEYVNFTSIIQEIMESVADKAKNDEVDCGEAECEKITTN